MNVKSANLEARSVYCRFSKGVSCQVAIPMLKYLLKLRVLTTSSGSVEAGN
jgi:hypothetical protein